MTTLVKKIVLYLSPLLFLFIGIEMFYRFVPNDYSTKYETIPKKTDTTEVLIFGNSHTFYGLNPKFFDRPTYNLAHISQTLYFDKLLFDNYIDEFKAVKCVILHIEYTSLSEIVDTKENNWRKYYYQTYMNLDVPSIKKYDYNKCILSSTRSVNANIKLMLRYLREGTLVDCDDNGFGTDYTKEKSISISKKDALLRVKNIEDNLMNFDDNIVRIQSIIAVCKERGIEVVLLNMPVTDYFSEGVNQLKLRKIQETCKTIADHNENVSYLNLFKDERFTNDDFYDADHMHTEGATKCSKVVNSYVEEILKEDNAE
ncbi:hypothetical protein [Flavobacterium sp. UBA6135]|uniref:hypothetical protein n=1 Tax=Flavobacterium sp. UBA6135 TaxID=1946553 RepID=UPI0025C2ECF1|nr:hypothetical protein [Flavobacterium sp. UBA6135]